MVKIRLWGEPEQLEELTNLLCSMPDKIRVLSISNGYKDRGNSVYQRCYVEVELNGPQTTQKLLK